MIKTCVICNKEYECSKDGRSKTCSISCRSELVRRTTFKNHGVLNISQKESVKKTKEEKLSRNMDLKMFFKHLKLRRNSNKPT